LRNWTTKALLTQAQLQAFGTSPPAPEIIKTMRDLAEFLNTAYSQTRNLGVLPQDRAVNFAATDAFVDLQIFKKVRRTPRFRAFEFDSLDVTRSPICRPDADCWDVALYFYDPSELRRARRAFRYTVDVSDPLPVVTSRIQEFTTR
jgi:hypothetical protein